MVFLNQLSKYKTL